MPTVRQALAYTTISLFVLFFFSYGLDDHLTGIWVTGFAQGRFPDFSRYEPLATLSAHQFPLDNPARRVIVVGDIHGMNASLHTLLIKLSYKASSDVLVHTGDIVAKGPLDGSLAVLSYMTRNKVQGVRGNHDQKVIEWRGWLKWVRSLPGGKKWLDETHSKWAEAQAKGERIESWIKKEKKKDKKWWTKLPEGWTLFGDHYNIARAMSESQFSYLLALPLKIHVPSAHVFIVHAGLLASDPRYSSYNSRQPLTRIPTIPSEKGGTSGGQDTESLRHLQEVAILNEVPQNRDPWAVLNMRGVKKGQVVRSQEGTPWSDMWNKDISHCEGFGTAANITTPKKDPALPCHPSTVIYGHAASRGIDVKRWSVGIDSGCVYKRSLTSLVLGPRLRLSSQQGKDGTIEDDSGHEDVDSKKTSIIPFGDAGKGWLVKVKCR